MSFSFGLITDIHIGYGERNNRFPSQVNSLEKLSNMASDFNGISQLFSMGDNAEDEFGGGNTSEQNLQLLKGVYSGILPDVQQQYLIGNHDLDTVTKLDWIEAQDRLVDIDAGRAYYSFDSGPYHFIILDPLFDSGGNDRNNYSNNYQYYIPTAQRTWLIDDLAETNKQCFVFCHVRFDVAVYGTPPPYLAINDADGVIIRGILEDSKKVEAVFHGHAHQSAYSNVNGIHYYTLQSVVDGDGVDDTYARVDVSNNGSFNITAFGNVDNNSAWTTTTFQLGGNNMSAQLEVTIPSSSVDADLVDFPLLIADDNMPTRFWRSVASDGSDIWFLAEDGTTKLESELVYIDVPNKRLEVYVKTNLSSSIDTVIFLNYGNFNLSITNDEGVWDSNFVMVQHMGQDPSGSAPQLLDSTDKDNYGTSGGSMTSDDLIDGLHGKAIVFDGINDRFEIPEAGITTDLDGAAQIVIEAIVVPNAADIAATETTILYNTGHTTNTFILLRLLDGHLGIAARSTQSDTLQSLLDDTVLLVAGNTYHLVALIDYTTENFKLYVNGSLVKEASSGTFNQAAYTKDTPSEPTKIGSNFNDGILWNNSIEDIKISKATRNIEWIKATHDNYFNTQDFYSIVESQIPASALTYSWLGGCSK